MNSYLPTLPDMSREIVATVAAAILLALLVHAFPQLGKLVGANPSPLSNSTL